MQSFQDIILTLQTFWSRRGCVLLQPYDLEVGAGTFHTATFLRAIGPEPWSAAYVQPSRRPKDGRYGQKTTLQPHDPGFNPRPPRRTGATALPHQGLKTTVSALVFANLPAIHSG